MLNYIFVPKSSSLSRVGGFCLSEVVSHEFFPAGFEDWRKKSSEALLKVNLKDKEPPLLFFGSVAEDLCSQIEEKLKAN